MNSIEELKDCVIADMIMKIKAMSRDELERELIELKSRHIESLRDLSELLKYGKQQSKT